MRERLQSLRRPALVGLVLAVPLGVLLAAPQASRAGGQGTGLPIPQFVGSFDPDFVLDAMNTSQAGAPAPRWASWFAASTSKLVVAGRVSPALTWWMAVITQRSCVSSSGVMVSMPRRASARWYISVLIVPLVASSPTNRTSG